MGHIFKTVTSRSYHFICDEIKYLSTSRDVIKEMGEPLIVDRGQTWIFCYHNGDLCGFMSWCGSKILYAFTIPEMRRNGVFSTLYHELPDKSWEVVASNDSYPIFLKKGFAVVKNYKKCHKLKLNGID